MTQRSALSGLLPANLRTIAKVGGDVEALTRLHREYIESIKTRWMTACDHRHGQDPIERNKHRAEAKKRREEHYKKLDDERRLTKQNQQKEAQERAKRATTLLEDLRKRFPQRRRRRIDTSFLRRAQWQANAGAPTVMHPIASIPQHLNTPTPLEPDVITIDDDLPELPNSTFVTTSAILPTA